jgi:Fic family protein
MSKDEEQQRSTARPTTTPGSNTSRAGRRSRSVVVGPKRESVEAFGWPAVEYESLTWEPKYPVSGQLNAPSRYQASIPASIANLDVRLSSEVQTLVVAATAEIARFDAEVQGSLAPFASILLRSEAAASSQIENLTASAKAVLMAEAGDTSRRNASLVAANTATMNAAIELADRLDADAVLSMHKRLLGGHEAWAGQWRQEPVWIGGGASSPRNATFVPPRFERVPGAIDDLMAYVARPDVPAMVKAVVGYAQFETIHPFPDGNGRTGRALIHAVLRNSGATTKVTIPVSAGLLADPASHFAALGAYRDGDPSKIVELAANARVLAGDVQRHHARWRLNLVGVRSDSAVWRTLDLLTVHPIVDAADIESNLGVSWPAANTTIKRLEDVGILQRANAGLRFRKWIASDISDALDAFAERSGRRSLT